MSTPKRTPLLKRILWFVLPFGGIATFVTIGIFAWASHQYFKYSISEYYAHIVLGIQREIGRYVIDGQQEMESLAQLLASQRLDPWQQAITLTAAKQTYLDFSAINLFSSQGQPLSSENEHAQSSPLLLGNITFQKAARGESARSEVLITKQRMPYIQLATPIMRLGKAETIIWSELSLKPIWKLLDKIKIGRTGHIRLYDSLGHLIADKEIDQVARTSLLDAKSRLDNSPKTSHQPTGWTEENDGERRYCVGVRIPDLNWIVVLSQDESEIHQYQWAAANSALFFMAILSITAGLVVWRGASKFLAPIYELHHQALAIKKGNYGQRVSIITNDEISDLALAFNEMATSIKTSTEMLKAESDRRRLLSKELVTSIENERRRVAMELHDNIGQTIVALKVQLERIEAQLGPTTAALATDLKSARKKAVKAIRDIKDTSYALTPTTLFKTLFKTGLISSLRTLIEDSEQSTGLKFHFFANDIQGNLSDEKALVLFRIAQEALSNIVKHSNAKEVHINLTQRDDLFSLSVEDDGVGFNPEEIDMVFSSAKTHWGLRFMKERAQQVDGELTIESKPGQGTYLLIEIPAERPRANHSE